MKRILLLLILTSIIWAAEVPQDGLKAEMNKEWDKAVTIYEQTLQEDPQRVDLWLRIADIQAQNKNFPATVNALEFATKLDPVDLEIKKKLVQAYVMNKQSNKAMLIQENMLASDPNNIKLLKDYGLLAEENKEWDKAITTYRNILEKEPSQIDLWQRVVDIESVRKNYPAMIEALKHASTANPQDATNYYKLAQVYSMNNKPFTALSEIEKALILDPQNSEYMKMKAQLVNWSKDYNIQYSKNRQLLAQNPNSPKALLGLAEAAFGLGKEKEAMNVYRQYVKLVPRNLKAWLELAELEKKHEGLSTALSSLEKALRLNGLRTDHKVPKKHANTVDIKVPILEYHCVDNRIKNEYFISSVEFDKQMRSLKKGGYNSVLPMDIYNYIFKGEKLPAKPVVITFDDGCQQNYTKIYPILKKHGLKGEFYLITDAVVELSQDRVRQNIETQNGKKQYSYLTWPEVRKMASNGMSFGSHTMTQPLLGNLSDEEISYQLLHSKLALKAYANIDPTDFSFPFGNGSFEKRIHKILQKYGYLNAVAAHGGIENMHDVDIYNMRRIEIYGPKPAHDPQSKGVSVTLDKSRPYDSFVANLEPSQAETYYQRANWYTDGATAEIAKNAVVSINKALKLEPDNMRYISDKALYASWAGELDESAAAYREYLSKYPDNKDALINYADIQSWRGDYHDALIHYNRYEERFGVDQRSMESKASMLAWAERPQMTFDIVEKIMQKDPNNYNANYANTVALKRANRPEEAIESLNRTEAIRPNFRDNELLRKFVMTDFRPHLRGAFRYYDDSDDIRVVSTYFDAKYSIDPSTFIYGGYGIDRLKAPIGSGYETIAGEERIDHTKGWIGMSHRFNPEVSIYGSIGGADVEVEDDFIYSAGIDWRLSDTLRARLSHSKDYYIVSPRAVSLGVAKNETAVNVEWYPSLLESVRLLGAYSTFSDDNTQWRVNLDYIHQVSRTQYWNFDAGVNANLFGFDKDLNNGYYDPEWSQTYSLIGYAYWKISEDDGVSIVVSAGMTKDDQMDNFEFASSINLEGRFGLYRDWYIILSAGYDNNRQQNAGAYKGTVGSISIMRRF